MRAPFAATAVAVAGLLSEHKALLNRALPNAPEGYVPTEVDCPTNRPSIRSAAKLSPHESSWLKSRREKTKPALKDFFGHVKIKDFDAAGYIDRTASDSPDLPNIGIAVSGGGYRALMTGAGALHAFDSRTENSTATGQLGGLLQSATYLAGLSGGGWLVGSVYLNNFTTISSLQTTGEGDVWQFENTIFEGPDDDSLQLFDSIDYFKNIEKAVSAKEDAGFNTSITDYWGRALAYQMINATDGGIDYTWSSIAEIEAFKSGDMPLPVLVADGRFPGELAISTNTTVFEFTPWEFGTYDPTIYGFAPLKYVGTKFVGGSIPKDEKCVRGYDNAGFIMGTSSSLFNQAFLKVKDSDSIPSFLKKGLLNILGGIGEDDDDIAVYTPNPFYQYRPESDPNSHQKELDVVDGGEDLQNLPLHPLIQPERHVDVIFAVDASADTTYSWPNGTALIASYERSLNKTGIANGTAFPAIPDANTFVNNGLNAQPTFFGCDSSNQTSATPLIVYLPNSPYTSFGNWSTFEPKYTNSDRDNSIINAHNMVTMGNGTRDADWPTCVGCAILSRSFDRTKTKVPEACTQCFDKYCWDGKTNTTAPAEYAPATVLGGKTSAGSLAGPTAWTGMVAAAVALFALV
ncbi:lysophospholipase Plb1 [Aspergillus campestris IBT 28561]|uniref:Lysophospholipase n=1 Tax=Aspergillus campestris (strain IBT 28561) TaxID=1392248 RepID=A0A2I1CRR2_ASPC2|nr:lysophospholipase Plb1 [Aspergillus campestris IBT 28561]PKY00307.1 lysophospholipase Plb1 [Aspergillus campestris IBT 28561]